MNREKYQKILSDLKSELEGELTQLIEESKPVAPDCSLGRLTRQEALQAQNVAKEALELREIRLRKVNAAMNRLENGTYGICIDCEEEIPEGRLQAQPEAALCIECANIRQKN